MGEQSVTRAKVHDPAAPEMPPHTPRHLPRLVQLLPGETSGATHRARDAMKQGVVRKAIQIVGGQPGFGRDGEHLVII